MSMFLSPGERLFLEALPRDERAVVEEFMVVFDARMIDVPQPTRALREGETEQQVLVEKHRPHWEPPPPRLKFEL